MSLDQIIANREHTNHSKNQNQNRGGSQLNRSRPSAQLNVKGSAGSRAARRAAPYQQIRSFPRHSSNDGSTGLKKDSAAIKFLLSNYLSGIFIGNGGSSIREMEQLCDASIHISNLHDNYPGTKDRVVFMSGSEPAVTLAQSLMWEMIGQQTYADLSKKGHLLWDPARAKDAPGQYDDITVEGKITIPALGAGSIIGRGGTTIKTLASETGVEVTLDAKEDAEFTHERVVTIAGTVAQCMNFTSMILHRLVQNNEATYVISGSTYPKRPNASFTNNSISRSKFDHGESQSSASNFPSQTAAQQPAQQIQPTPSLPHSAGRPVNPLSGNATNVFPITADVSLT